LNSWTMSRRLLGEPTKLVSELTARGYGYFYQAKSLLVRYLTELGRDITEAYTIAPATGWNKGSFVLPTVTIGDDSIRYLDVEPPKNPSIQSIGSLEDWQRTIGTMAAGNSRLIGAIGIALAPSLLKPLGFESGGIHFFGASSTGKTTALNVALSVTGEQKLATWNATANGQEAVAEAHSDLMLALDEIGQADPRVVAATAYALGNEVGKGRMSKETTARRQKTWRLLFLSTGEVPMLDYLQTGGLTAKGGQESRMPSIPADAGQGLGLFDTIHGWKSSQEFADALKAEGLRYRGTALKAFLDRLVPTVAENQWSDRHKAITDILKMGVADPDGTVGRVARRFALIQLALELAQSWGVTLFPDGDVEWAISTLFKAWIEARGGAGSIDITQACDRIALLFTTEEHGNRIRGDGAGSDDRTQNLLAYKVGSDFLVPAEVFKVLCQGVDRNKLIKELHARGWLAGPDIEGKNSVARWVEGKNRRVYTFTRFWGGEDYPTEVPVIPPGAEF
jgi:putative DNA primase/helicase